MKIQYGSVFGNYKWQAEADVSDDLVPVLCGLGALQVGQRTPSSAAEKEMAGYDKRPKGFNRTDDIPFTPEGSAILEKHLRTMKVEIGRDAKDAPIYAEIDADVVVEAYVPATADVKMTDERNAYARHGKAGDLPAFAKTVGYDGAVGDGVAENAPVEFLRAIRRYVNEQLKTL